MAKPQAQKRKGEYRQVMFRDIPEDLYLHFKAICIREKVKMRERFMDWIREYIKGREDTYSLTEEERKQIEYHQRVSRANVALVHAEDDAEPKQYEDDHAPLEKILEKLKEVPEEEEELYEDDEEAE